MKKKAGRFFIKTGCALLSVCIVICLFAALSEKAVPGIGMTDGAITLGTEGNDITELVIGASDSCPVAENDSFILALTPQADIVVTSKLTDQSWRAVPAAGEGPYGASVILHYFDGNSAQGVMYSDTDSVDRDQFRVTQDTGGVSVEYIFGEAAYYYPTQITQTRMNSFLQNLSSEDADYILRRYQFYHYDELVEFNSKEEVDRIVAQYPALTSDNLYVLNALSMPQKKKTSRLFAEAGYTDAEKKMDESAGNAESENPLSFYARVSYALTEDGFTASVDRETLQFYESCPLTSLELLPFFGASGTAGGGDADSAGGWLMIPQGSGALLDLSPGKPERVVTLPVYGKNGTKERSIPQRDGLQCSIPMFGHYADAGAYLCVITENAANAKINAMRSDAIACIGTEFNIVDTSVFTLSARSPANLFTREMDGGKLALRYYLMPNADENSYADMAASGRAWMAENGLFNQDAEVARDAQLLIRFSHVISDKTLFGGFIPAEKEVTLTAFSDADSILAQLKETCGAANLSSQLTGWSGKGLNRQIPGRVKVSAAAGGIKGLTSLLASAKNAGIRVYVDAEMVFAPLNTLGKDKTVLDLTRGTVPLKSRSVLSGGSFNAVTPSLYRSLAEGYAERSEFFGGGIGVSQLGSLLFTDDRATGAVTRVKSQTMTAQALEVLKNSGAPVTGEIGNLYTLPYFDLVTDFSTDVRQTEVYDRTIPFAAMLLHGAVNYVCAPINLQEDPRTALLYAAESGSGLCYSVTANGYSGLFDTVFSSLYPTVYPTIAEEIKTGYQKLGGVLEGLGDRRIIAHEALDSGLRVVTYEGGARVLVNYSYSDVTYETIVVPARDFTRVG